MNTKPSLSIQARLLKQFIVLEIEGPITMFTSPEVRNSLVRCYDQDKGIIVDLSGVHYMDSSGVATLVEGLSWSRKRKKEFVLVGLGLNVYNAFYLNKLNMIFNIRSGISSPPDGNRASDIQFADQA